MKRITGSLLLTGHDRPDILLKFSVTMAAITATAP
jgi:hypothetical protein